jgi:C4-type Zn-finger protein
VEGILEQIHEELAEKAFVAGDSAGSGQSSKLEEFLDSLKQVRLPLLMQVLAL